MTPLPCIMIKIDILAQRVFEPLVHKEVTHMKNYEAIVIFYPDIEETRREKDLERLQEAIKQNGKINNIDEWGTRKLAYEIEYYKEAYYVLIEFEAENETLEEFDRIAKILDSVMRHMIVRVDE